MTKRAKAKNFARWYFRLLADKSGLRWDGDNETEIEEMIDCLIDAAKEEMAQSKAIKII